MMTSQYDNYLCSKNLTVHKLYLMKIIICKRQKKWQHCCILNSMLNSNSEVIFQEQRLDCATNMAKKLPVGKLELIYNEFRGSFRSQLPRILDILVLK